MSAAILGARLVMAAVLAVAGASKLSDPQSLALAAENLGVPWRIARVVGRVQAPVEIAIAVALLPGATAWWASLAAGALFFAFTVIVGVNLALGRRPECQCFGALHSSALGWRTLVRNVTLVGLAGVALVADDASGGPGALAWASNRLGDGRFSPLTVLLACAAVVEAGIIWRLHRGQDGSVVANAPTGLPVGSPAPEFSLPDLAGREWTLADLRQEGKPVLLLFTDPLCGPCQRLLPEAAGWHEPITLAVFTRGEREQNLAKARDAGVSRMLLQSTYSVGDAYGASGTPSAVVVGVDGRVMTPVALGASAIRETVASLLPETETSDGNPVTIPLVGDDAPELVLPAVEGPDVDLAMYRGRLTLIVFWDPLSRNCQDLLPALRIWERDRHADDAHLLLVSREPANAMKAVGFRAAVAIDVAGVTARAFGVPREPGAVLVDAWGRIAAPPVVGAGAALDLAKRASALTNVAARMAPPRGVPVESPGVRRPMS